MNNFYFWIIVMSISFIACGLLLQAVCNPRLEEISTRQEIDQVAKMIPKLFFTSIVMSGVVIVFCLIFYINNLFGNLLLIKTGVHIPLILWLSGNIIRAFYKQCMKERKLRELSDEEMFYYLIMIPVLCDICMVIYNHELALIILGIIIGKFLWIDTKMGFGSRSDIKNKIV